MGLGVRVTITARGNLNGDPFETSVTNLEFEVSPVATKSISAPHPPPPERYVVLASNKNDVRNDFQRCAIATALELFKVFLKNTA